MTFGGFPSGGKATAIPDVFFVDLLPSLRDREDVLVALSAFRALSRRRGYPRYITAGDIAGEPALAAMAAEGGDAIGAALLRLAEAGMLLRLAAEADGVPVDVYFLNAPADRRGMAAVQSGAVDIGVTARPVQGAAAASRSGIFPLYESLVGTISPLIAEELMEAERLYPAAWLEAAFREAAAQNARSWRYVSRILERWAIEGRDHETTERGASGDERYYRGKYGQILKQRLQG